MQSLALTTHPPTLLPPNHVKLLNLTTIHTIHNYNNPQLPSQPRLTSTSSTPTLTLSPPKRTPKTTSTPPYKLTSSPASTTTWSQLAQSIFTSDSITETPVIDHEAIPTPSNLQYQTKLSLATTPRRYISAQPRNLAARAHFEPERRRCVATRTGDSGGDAGPSDTRSDGACVAGNECRTVQYAAWPVESRFASWSARHLVLVWRREGRI